MIAEHGVRVVEDRLSDGAGRDIRTEVLGDAGGLLVSNSLAWKGMLIGRRLYASDGEGIDVDWGDVWRTCCRSCGGAFRLNRDAMRD